MILKNIDIAYQWKPTVNDKGLNNKVTGYILFRVTWEADDGLGEVDYRIPVIRNNDEFVLDFRDINKISQAHLELIVSAFKQIHDQIDSALDDLESAMEIIHNTDIISIPIDENVFDDVHAVKGVQL